MSLGTLSNHYFFNYFINLKSERIGLYISFFLHCFILLMAIGLPNFFGPVQINVPNIIPIEIVNVSDVTSISKEVEENNKKEIAEEVLKNKKFNNSENQEIKSIDIKEKPPIKVKNIEITKTKVGGKVIEKKIKNPIKLINEEKNIEEEKVESLPFNKIQPKIKPELKEREESPNIEKNIDMVFKASPKIKPDPKTIKPDPKTVKVQPKSKPAPKFNFATMLKDLRNEESSIIDNEQDKKLDKKTEISKNNDNNNKSSQLTISEIDLLIQQLSSCWNSPAGAVIKTGMVVRIEAKIQSNRRILEHSIRIIDTNISKSNPFYKPITESAMRTLMNPLCIPLKLPEDKYDLWKKLTITFDHSIMKGY